MLDIFQLIKQLPEEEIYKAIVRRFISKDFDQAFENSNRIVCISPHPDDCDEVGVGRIIAKYADTG